ncbi:MAG: fatty acid desaturase [Silvibacterium sp.]|jgi:fatty acid desaturase
MVAQLSAYGPRNFVRRSNLRGFLAIARDWLAIAALIYIGIRVHRWLLYPILAWLIGTFQFALSESLLHEASHWNLFQTRRWNDSLDFLFGLPFFRTTEQLRLEHKIHHRFLGEPQDALHLDYEKMGLYRPNVNLVWVWFCRPLLGYAGVHYALALTLKPIKDGMKIIVFWIAVLSLCAYLHWLRELALYWLVPLLWSCYSNLYWSEITDHYRASTGIRSNFNPWSNFLHHNNGYHFTHHTYASIPWYLLPAATRALCADRGDICRGFFDVYRSIRSGPRVVPKLKHAATVLGVKVSHDY